MREHIEAPTYEAYLRNERELADAEIERRMIYEYPVTGEDYEVISAGRVPPDLKIEPGTRRYVRTGSIELTMRNLNSEIGRTGYAYASETEDGYEIEWDTLDTSGVR